MEGLRGACRVLHAVCHEGRVRTRAPLHRKGALASFPALHSSPGGLLRPCGFVAALVRPWSRARRDRSRGSRPVCRDPRIRCLPDRLLEPWMEADDTSQSGVNREIYDRLGDRWYTAKDDPVALLRAENRCRNPWISGELAKKFAGHPCRVLDVGCGAGFLANDLARRGHAVVGLDSSAEALSVAAAHDETRSVVWKHNDADPLPFEANSFEVVCAMDFLEH